MKNFLVTTKTFRTLTILVAALCVSLSPMQKAFANDKGVAKAVLIKGVVTNIKTNKVIVKDEWLEEGAVLKTSEKSFAKLLFIDKSTMNVGANSQIEIQSFAKDKPGIVNLVEGEVRSQVTKNYMDMKKGESKLFIKTRTAAMGVRGTHFQVNFNPANMNTSLITFEGAVAIGAINDFTGKKFNQRILEKIVSDPSAVMVTRGEFSGVMPSIDSKPVAPVKINSKQLKALEKNDGSVSENENPSTNSSDKKPALSRGTIPPGVSGEEFQGVSKDEVVKEMAKVDKNVTVLDQTETKSKETALKSDNTPANANKTFRDGGYINTEVVAYIAPPKNAAIDPMTKQPIIPVALGSIDPATGNYKNDYFKLKNDMTWKPIETKSDTGRSPASGALAQPNLLPPPSLINECTNCAVSINTKISPTTTTTSIDTTKVIESSETKIDTIINNTKSSTKTKVNIKID